MNRGVEDRAYYLNQHTRAGGRKTGHRGRSDPVHLLLFVHYSHSFVFRHAMMTIQLPLLAEKKFAVLSEEISAFPFAVKPGAIDVLGGVLIAIDDAGDCHIENYKSSTPFPLLLRQRSPTEEERKDLVWGCKFYH